MNRSVRITVLMCGLAWPAFCAAEDPDSVSFLRSLVARYERDQQLLNAYSSGRLTINIGEALFQFVYIPAGDYIVGITDEERHRLAHESRSAFLGWNSFTRREIRLAEGFFLLDREVTIRQFGCFQPSDRSEQGVGTILPDDRPQTTCTWEDCARFCESLSLASGWSIRLPSEIEWEVAARGPEGRLFSDQPAFSLPMTDENSAIISASDLRPLLADQPRDRGWNGVFDMRGNAREWCLDVYDAEASDESPVAHAPSAVVVEPCPASLLISGRVERTCRGGDFRDEPPLTASPLRRSLYQDESADNLGFRLVLIPHPQLADSSHE